MKNEIRRGLFSQKSASLFGASIATQPNGSLVLITHWVDKFKDISALITYEDLIYVGDVCYGIPLLHTYDLKTDLKTQWNKQFNKYKK